MVGRIRHQAGGGPCNGCHRCGGADSCCCRDDLIVVVIVVFRWHRKHGSFGGIDRLAPELQVPVHKGSIVLIDYGVSDDNSPGANSGFTPVKLLDKYENEG